MFTIGHDCGHGSFSRNALLNWCVGAVFHTLVMTPYESWRVTHRHHHKYTGNIDKDEIFFPMRESEDRPKTRNVIKFVPLGWFIYLIFGYSPRVVYHFNPWDTFFVKYRATTRVAFSLVIFALWVLALSHFTRAFGFLYVLEAYAAPVTVFASWLVITTFLHHNEPGTECKHAFIPAICWQAWRKHCPCGVFG